MTTTTLYSVPAPKHASLREWDCARCEHEALKHPIFLSDGNAYGTGCAAKLMGREVAEIVREQIAAEPALVPLVAWLDLCRPGRVTPKFVAEMTARFYRASADEIERAVALWKATK